MEVSTNLCCKSDFMLVCVKKKPIDNIFFLCVICFLCFGSGRPFDVAVFENVLWVSDWEGHLLYRLDMRRTGQNLEHVHDDSIQPASLVIVHPLAKPGRCCVLLLAYF